MKKGFLSQYFEAIAAKRLQAVEVDPESSNQHEINGVGVLKKVLGTERLSRHPVRMIWLGGENEVFSEDSWITWYDSRKNQPRAAEFRLFYASDSAVMDLASEGNLFIIAKRPDGSLMIIVTPADSTIESQLLWLFGVPVQVGTSFEYRIFDRQDSEVDLASRFILEELGIEIEDPDSDALDRLLEKFSGSFPGTAKFSLLARESLPDADPVSSPDATLLAWVEREEKLFRRLEKRIISERLQQGFSGSDGIDVDVDGFISFSLSVLNRRKSRAGYSFEHHFEAILKAGSINYSRQAITENKSKPDFLFPGITEYNDRNYPSGNLTMLGLKSSCKERWAQVLQEADRIPEKHLLTLEPGISESQTTRMAASKLQLVLPEGIHDSYSASQQKWLMSVEDFLRLVSERQQRETI
ncbi:MAG TPA: restriction endonuclease [Gammaproteobacteria bacterium]|nr:restriction endonuclease [Gammaproteobacteria bacterium]